jgi:hypothetical protein
MNPSCNRYGSLTSSSVTVSSDIVAASASKPAGPPLNRSISPNKYFLSVISSPALSISSLFNA